MRNRTTDLENHSQQYEHEKKRILFIE